jgi:hypothetical protein
MNQAEEVVEENEEDIELYLVTVKLITGEEIIGVTDDPDMKEDVLILDNPLQIYTKHMIDDEEDEISSNIMLVRYMGYTENNILITKERNVLTIAPPNNILDNYYTQFINSSNQEIIGTIH